MTGHMLNYENMERYDALRKEQHWAVPGTNALDIVFGAMLKDGWSRQTILARIPEDMGGTGGLAWENADPRIRRPRPDTKAEAGR